MNRKSRTTAWPLLITPLIGCGGPEIERVALVRAGGTVTLDGRPLQNAVVVFEAPSGAFSFAKTDARGHYTLRFDSREFGVTPGRKTVRISTNRRIYGLDSHDEGSPDDRAGGAFPPQPREQVPERYNARSELSTEVTRDQTVYDFHLHP
jgi:hypothetical protein